MFSASIDTGPMDNLLVRFASGAGPRMPRLLKRVGLIMLEMIGTVFEAWGANLIGGTRWEDLSPVTIALRNKRRRVRKSQGSEALPLQDTGTLRGSVSHGTAVSGPPGAYRSLGGKWVAIGTNLDYAADQQLGRARGTVKVKRHYRKSHWRKRKGAKRGRVEGHLVQAHDMKTPRIPPRPYCGWTERGSANAVNVAAEEVMGP